MNSNNIHINLILFLPNTIFIKKYCGSRFNAIPNDKREYFDPPNES